jgi:GR25 family glycosyltransferase involved in LPS biosynthesis
MESLIKSNLSINYVTLTEDDVNFEFTKEENFNDDLKNLINQLNKTDKSSPQRNDISDEVIKCTISHFLFKYS